MPDGLRRSREGVAMRTMNACGARIHEQQRMRVRLG
jgi:hypothetical protein